MALCCGSILVDIDCRVESVLLLVNQISDCNRVQTIQPNVSIAACEDVNKVSGLTSSVSRGAVLLASTCVRNALTLKNSNALKVEILDSG